MNRLRVMTIVGTRPEIIRLSSCIKANDRYFDHVLVHTGQNWDYTLNEIFFEELGLREPDHYLSAAGQHLGETIGNIIARSYTLMQEVCPDALLILGDTNSALSAIAAKRLKIPIFHMEAGNRCFDQNVPEEINRKIVDHIADINLPYTEHSRRYLLSEGIRKEHIFVTGSPMQEVLGKHAAAIDSSKVLETLGLVPENYFLVSAHREENIDHAGHFEALVDSLNQLADAYQYPIIYSTHPRTWKRIEAMGIEFNPLIRQLRPFGFFDYNKLQKHAYCVLSDSGTLSEESAMLQFPAVLLRNSTERPEVLDKGSMVIGGFRAADLLQSVDLCRNLWQNQQPLTLPDDYRDHNVSEKVVRIVQSYTKIINEHVWRKF